MMESMKQPGCSVDGCDRPHYGRKLCEMHYQRLRATGTTGPAGPVKRRRICNVDGCGKPRHGQGYCGPHYRRFVRHGDPLVTTRTNYGLDFWERVDKSGDCWEWTGSRTKFGYGQTKQGLRFGVQSALAHRISWVIANGPVPGGACVLHRCDNPPCVRPEHLFLGSRADNSADMISKGRGRFNDGRTANSFTQGTRNARAKLTEAQVVEIRKRAVAGEHYIALAVEFGISESRANAIVIGNGWRHIWPYFEERSGPKRTG